MSFKLLNNVLPLEIVKTIHEYDNTYTLRMKNVINQIDKLKNDVDEYWYVDECLYYMTEEEESYRLKLGLRVTPLDWPLPGKKCFRYWNREWSEETSTQSQMIQPRDNW
jgi:hypothetical protein